MGGYPRPSLLSLSGSQFRIIRDDPEGVHFASERVGVDQLAGLSELQLLPEGGSAAPTMGDTVGWRESIE